MRDGDREMRLRYAGRCVQCGADLPQGTLAIYNSIAKKVRHLDCAGAEAPSNAKPESPTLPPTTEIDRGVAGASAMREFQRRQANDAIRHESRVAQSKAGIEAVFGTGFLGKVATLLAVDDSPPRARSSTKVWETGARGEERVGATLDTLGEVGVITLHDRKIPGSRANIDHLVITPWGVWVVDAKRYVEKKVDFDVVDSFLGFGGRKRLLVGGRDKTDLVDGVQWQMSKVQEALGSEIEVKGCLCFIDSVWPMLLADFSMRGVYICWPKKLTKTLLRSEEPVLDPEAVARRLSVAFPAAR